MCFLCLIRPKMALLSYVNSDISKNSPLLTIWWNTNNEKNNKNNNKKNLSNTRKSSSSIIEDSKVNKKNQMKVSNEEMSRGHLHHKMQKRAWYMVMYIKLSVADKTRKCCYQSMSMAFHSCRTSKQLSRRQ